MKRIAGWLAAALWLVVSPLHGQQAATPAPVRIPTPGGAVVSSNPTQHRAVYEGDWHYAPARVEGGLVYISGMVAVAPDSAALDSVGLQEVFRRTWRNLRTRLEAAGSSTADLVELTTFHVFNTPAFAGTKDQHLAAFVRAKNEFVQPPYPAWTGVAVADLFPDCGLVEIRVMARVRTPPTP